MEDDLDLFLNKSLEKINNLKNSYYFNEDDYKEKITKYLNTFIKKYDLFNGYIVSNDIDLDEKPYCCNMLVDIILYNRRINDNYLYIFFSKSNNELINMTVVNTFKSKYRCKYCYLISYDYKSFIRI